MLVNKRKYFRTSRQMWAHLLCRECEQRFSRNGEQWVSENGFRGQGNFRLQSVLKNSTPVGRNQSSQYFGGNALQGVDMDQLCYFAASVFWRAAVHRWGGEEYIDLGPIYAEQFRRFLIGEADFPANAVLVIHVSSADKPMEGAFAPSGGKVLGTPYHQYTFFLPGMLFTLAVGGRIPSGLRAICAVRSPNRLIFLSDKVQKVFESAAVEMLARNEMVRREILEGLPPRKI
ncbi:MAG: hypothetical protein ABSH49_36790 [Bryobacteraceae bacterium]